MSKIELPPHFQRDTVGTRAALHAALQLALRSIRDHVRLEAVFVSQFSDGPGFYIGVDRTEMIPYRVAPRGAGHVQDPLCAWLAWRILTAPTDSLPDSLPDILDADMARGAPTQPLITQPTSADFSPAMAPPFRTVARMPLQLQNGETYGTLCVFADDPGRSLSRAEATLLQTFAQLATSNLEILEAVTGTDAQMRRILAQILGTGTIETVFQPICRLSDGVVVGQEGLSRFPGVTGMAVQEVFVAAERCGLQQQLEIEALRRVVHAGSARPEGQFLTFNLSAETLICPEMKAWAEAVCLRGLVAEISERSVIEDYDRLAREARDLRDRGLKIAIDDVGAGHAGFQHILALRPDIIKLDGSLTRRIVDSREHRAMIAAITGFCRDIDCLLVLEGIETAQHHAIARDLGITFGQGYHLGHPVALPRG